MVAAYARREIEYPVDHTLTFYEYVHGDTGVGLGASHQTGWTGLIAKLLQTRGGVEHTEFLTRRKR